MVSDQNGFVAEIVILGIDIFIGTKWVLLEAWKAIPLRILFLAWSFCGRRIAFKG